MKGAMVILFLVAIGAGVLVFNYLGVRSLMVAKNGAVKAEWAQVEAALQHRADLIQKIVEAVKGYAPQEQALYSEVVTARAALLSARSPRDKVAANQQLDAALGRVLAVGQNDPQLRSDENFQHLQHQLAGAENRIAIQGKRYDDALQDYNAFVTKFPNRIIANWAGYKRNDAYFSASEPARQVPKVDLSTPQQSPAPTH